MSSLIERICCAHIERSDSDPLITTLDGGTWAFCVGGAADGHDWRRIEPTLVDSLRARPRLRNELITGALPEPETGG
jgi:hypothetical protein